MAATIPHPPASTPPTPPTSLPAFARVTSASLLQRNASTSSSLSTATSESTSSLVAVPIRPPPIQTRTAATPDAQLASDAPAPDYLECGSHGRGYNLRQGPRIARSRDNSGSSVGPAGGMLMPVATISTASFATPARPTIIPPLDRSASLPPNPSMSPTTPQARFHHRIPPWAETTGAIPPPASPGRPRISLATDDLPRSSLSNPSTPTHATARKPRSVNDADLPDPPHERRSSQVSTNSNGSASSKRPQLSDFVLGDELGRGSYSEVVRATQSFNPRIPHDVAIKIMNQYHLIQEKKAKYAHIERDCLIRLGQPRTASPTVRTHRRGVSNSSTGSATMTRKPASVTGLAIRRDSNNSNSPNGGLFVSSSAPAAGLPPRHIGDASPRVSPAPLSPLISASMRLAKAGDSHSQTQEFLDERAGTPVYSSRPPSPVQEEPGQRGSSSEEQAPHRTSDSSDGQRPRTPRKRRPSGALSEAGGGSSGAHAHGHPGVIRLFCTFVDRTSVYYVIELASNGELASTIRKLGSMDLESSRFYAAQLLDTIEFIHDRDIIHRDLKPENILLDSEMRIRVTDFGSAKILGRKEEPSETSKRSFVGSAEYVSPEVLNDQPVSNASDIWAFGVVLYNFITGTTPFRGATEFLTFQKVLHRELSYPEGFDPVARDLVDRLLDLDPAKRPTVAEIKAHPFFAAIDWATLWQVTPPPIRTGISPPQQPQGVNLDSDVWAAFEDDDDSDDEPQDASSPIDPRFAEGGFAGVRFPHHDSPSASIEDLGPPRPAWIDDETSGAQAHEHKLRGWSTSSSSSAGGRLSIWLENMGINNQQSGRRAASSRASRYSDRSDDRQRLDDSTAGTKSPRNAQRSRATSPATARSKGVTSTDNSRWMPLMVANERIVLSTPIMTKADNSVPSFLLPVSKRRQLILTDLPRLLEVKDDAEFGPKVKHEFAFINHPHPRSPPGGDGINSSASSPETSAPLYVLEVQEKTSKVFVLQTATQAYTFAADTPDIRAAWMHMLRKVA